MNTANSILYHTIKTIPNDYLRTINSVENTYFSKGFLEAYERSNPNIDFKYIVIEEAHQAIALANIQIIELNIDVILKNTKMPSLLRRILHYLFCNSPIKIMFCGNVFLSGEHGISIKEDCDKTQIIQIICKELIKLSKSIKPLHAIFIKDFVERSRAHSDYFIDCGFTPMRIEPNMIISLQEGWNSFEDYKKTLKSKYRVKVNKADKTSKALETKRFSESDFELYKDELQHLYENTIANANFNAQVLNLNTYIKLRELYQDDFIVKAYFLDGKLVGFLSALLNKGALDAHFIGLDYTLNKQYAIYPRILNDYIRIGIENKVRNINLGRTASEIKTTVGAEPVKLICYLKHKRKWINALIRPFVKNVKLKDFKQHQPFKLQN
jgi:hypothetical protein